MDPFNARSAAPTPPQPKDDNRFLGHVHSYSDVVVNAGCVSILAERELMSLTRAADDALAENPPAWFSLMLNVSPIVFPQVLSSLANRIRLAVKEHSVALSAVTAAGWLGSIEKSSVKKLREAFDAMHIHDAADEKRRTKRGLVTWGSEVASALEHGESHQIHAIIASTLPGAPFIGGGSSPPVVPYALTSSRADVSTLRQFSLPTVARDAPLFLKHCEIVSRDTHPDIESLLSNTHTRCPPPLTQGVHVMRVTLNDSLKSVISTIVKSQDNYNSSTFIDWESVFVNVCKTNGHGNVAGDVAALLFPDCPSPSLLRFPRDISPAAKAQFDPIIAAIRGKMEIPTYTLGSTFFTKLIDALESMVECTASTSVRVPLEPVVVGWSAAEGDAPSSIVLLSAQFGASAFMNILGELSAMLLTGKTLPVFAAVRVTMRAVLAGNMLLTCMQEEVAALRSAISPPLSMLASQLLTLLTVKGDVPFLLMRIYEAVFVPAAHSRCKKKHCLCIEQYQGLDDFVAAIRRGENTRACLKAAIERQTSFSMFSTTAAHSQHPLDDDIFTFRDDTLPTSLTPILSAILRERSVNNPRTLDRVDAAFDVISEALQSAQRGSHIDVAFLRRDIEVYRRMRARQPDHPESLDDWTAGCSRAVAWDCVCSPLCTKITSALKAAARPPVST